MYPRDEGPIYFSEVHCAGSEHSLFDCVVSDNLQEIMQTCDHSMDVGVSCTRETSSY